MDKINEKKHKALIHKLGLKYRLPDKIMKQLVESPYEFSAEQIKKLNINDLRSEEELNNTKTNFMYTGFAKLFINPVAFNKRLNKYLTKYRLRQTA